MYPEESETEEQMRKEPSTNYNSIKSNKIVVV